MFTLGAAYQQGEADISSELLQRWKMYKDGFRTERVKHDVASMKVSL